MELYQKTWLYFFLYDAIGDEFLEYNLPAPNYLLHAQKEFLLGGLLTDIRELKKAVSILTT